MTDAGAATPTYLLDRTVGRRVIGRLKAAGGNQRDMANAIGMDNSALSRSINGHRRWNLDELFDIAKYLDLPITALLTDDSNDGNPLPLLAGRQIRCTHARLAA